MYKRQNKYLPGDRIGVLVADDNYDDELITCLTVTNNTKGDLTITIVDRFYDKIICNNHMTYYYERLDRTNLNGNYINNDNIKDLNKNDLCMFNLD